MSGNAVRLQFEYDRQRGRFDKPDFDLRPVLSEPEFLRAIMLERKRADRSQEPFLLMLLDVNQAAETALEEERMQEIARAVVRSCRETDTVGWYKQGSTIGVMYTCLQANASEELHKILYKRIEGIFHDERVFTESTQVGVSFHLFPDEWGSDNTRCQNNATLYPDLMVPGRQKRAKLVAKRMIDVVGSLMAILLISPLLAAIWAAVKLTSKGPALFCQKRVGQYGKSFTMLKFRSMYINNDSAVHQQFVKNLIQNQVEGSAECGTQGAFKIKNDPRITPIGKFLRKTSLDELPQFFNVLFGTMSLVGPRPALYYELDAYQTWHRRRVLEAKPGITGLWQVIGRSRVRFDEMVRLDLRYATQWTPWLDLKILFMTPLAVIRGSGAQ